MLSVFITPWTKPTSIQCAISDACAADHRFEQRQIGMLGVGGRRVMAHDRVVGQPP
ncbi:hypothetical protein I545_6970 [Mycobacterium kansasii 662]|uniref:Uncharacterized protein n=1 Tax=Mycobacterium kansasii 662 TaxID=1299326 RepID=X7XNS9_MYCKA|nr:hypothetical protein I545_6970 [Mycobacterium kansasii 662]